MPKAYLPGIGHVMVRKPFANDPELKRDLNRLGFRTTCLKTYIKSQNSFQDDLRASHLEIESLYNRYLKK